MPRVEGIVYRQELLFALFASPAIPRRLRSRLWAATGLPVRGALIESGVRLLGRHISVGAGSYIGRHCYLDAYGAPITIGTGCAIGPHTKIVTATHDVGPRERRAGALRGEPISIGDGCWIGGAASVFPGVTIAPGCVIAGGAVVVRDTEPDGIYAGVPARRIRDV